MRLSALLSGVAFVALLSSGQALAGIPVTDQAVTQNTARTAGLVQDQVNLLKEVKAINEDTYDALGKYGTPEKSFAEMPQWEDFKGGGKIAEALKDFGPNTCALVACRGEGGGEEAQLDDYAGTIGWVRKSFYAASAPNGAQRNDLNEIRQRAGREAAMAAYGMSMISRDYLAGAQERGTKLEEIANSGDSLRADMRANTAVTLAQYQQATHMLALVTALVEMEAASQINADPQMVTQGGGTPANVRDDADYDISGNRRSVTKTNEGDSAGGKAFDSKAGSAAAPSSGVTGPDAAAGKNGIAWNGPRQGSGATGSPNGDRIIWDGPRVEETLRGSVGSRNTRIDNAISQISKSQPTSLLDQVGVIAKVTGDMIKSSGNRELGSAVGNLGKTLSRSNGNPNDILWGSADVMAKNSGDRELANLVNFGKKAAASNDERQMNELFRTAAAVAQASGDSNAYHEAQRAERAYRDGAMGADEAALLSVGIISQHGGYQNGGDVSYVTRNAGTKDQNALYELGMDIIATVGKKSGDEDVKALSSAVSSNKKALRDLLTSP